jgi:signal transduction histidine kinase/ligand-binding sensor domain-containing protein/CheY-like chemotaxis protein
VPARALDPHKAITQYGHDVWEVKDGLPQNSVQAILQSRDGYLWLGTQEGLVRFDGVRFRVYDKRNTPGILHNSIQCLLEDRDGAVWFGTFVGGLTRLKGDRATSVTTREGLSSDQVWSLFGDDDGTVWVGTNAGLNRLKDGRITVYHTQDGLTDDQIWAIAKTTDGSLWFGTHRGGLNRLKDGRFSSYTTKDGLSNDQVRALYPDADGSLWIGTYGGGVDHFKDGAVSRHYAVKDGLASALVSSILRDRDANLWIATSEGISRLTQDRLTSYTTRQGLSNGIAGRLYEDREGSLWIGTNGGGLNRFHDGAFTNYGTAEGLSHDLARTILEDRQGALWVATDSGLNRLQNGRWTQFTTRDGLVDNQVFSLHEGRDGSLWIGTHGGGLNRLKDGRLTSYTTRQGLSNPIVRSIVEDQQGDVWIGTDSGLNRLRDGRFTVYTTKDGLSNDRVFVIHEDRSGALWLGTGGGLTRLKDGVFTPFTAREGLSSLVVFAIYEDREGTLWFGTDGGGLDRLKDGKLTAITTKAGLFDDLIVQILEDKAGSLWLTSNRGVSRVSKRDLDDFAQGRRQTVEVANFGVSDGMKSGECHGGSQPAGWRSRDGRLWFPTLKGAVVVDPRRLAAAAGPLPPVVLEELRVDGRPFETPPQLTFSPGAESFELHYTALSFRDPLRISFRYRLEGFDRDWVEAGPRRTAYYTHLPPGRYVFQVSACTHDGACNNSGAGLAFRVRPRVYQTWWFPVLTVLGAVLVGLASHRVRVHRLQMRERALMALVEARTHELREQTTRAEAANRAKSSFLANVSHELRTPLNAILGFVQLMERKPGRDGEDREHLEIITRSGEHLLGLINDVLSLSKIEAGQSTIHEAPFELGRLLAGLHEMFLGRAQMKGLELRFESAPDLPPFVRGDEGKLRQVLINLIGNAVKFTTTGRITVRSSWAADRGRFEVADTGPGIPRAEQEELFGPFVQSQAAHGAREAGAGLGLAISRSFARLMGGDVTVQSTPGQGATFVVDVSLPRAEVVETGAPRPVATELQAGQRRRILVVDDRPENRTVLSRLHELLGLEVREAADGAEAIEVWRSWRPDLIWMDARMPRLDGASAAQQIRREEQGHPDRPPVVIIAVTASAFEHDKDALLAAGCDGFVAKPFRQETLFGLLEKHLGLRFERPSQSTEPADAALTPARLAALGPSWLGRLQRALVEADVQRASLLLEALQPIDPELAGSLASRIRRDQLQEVEQAVTAALGGLPSSRP